MHHESIVLSMKQHFSARALLKRLLAKLREFFERPTDVHYTSVPYWRPWRDF